MSLTNKNFSSILCVKGLELFLHIGVPEEERAGIQRLVVNLDVSYANSPSGCLTDEIEDTVCYDELCTKLKSAIEAREFKLIEYLAAEILAFVKPFFPNSTVAVEILKWPAIKDFTGSVSFKVIG